MSTTELERIAQRHQGGNTGQESPCDPYQMVRFGNSRKVRGLVENTGLGRNAKGRASLRGMAHRIRQHVLADRQVYRQAPVTSRVFSDLEKHSWAKPCNDILPTRSLC